MIGRHLVLTLALAGLLAGCGDIPQPFRHDGLNPALAPVAARGVVVRPPGDDERATRVADAIVRRLLESEIPASTKPVMAGAWLIAAEIDPGPTATRLTWRLTRGDAEVMASLTQTIPAGPWSRATPKTIEIIAAEVADKLSPPLHGESADTPSPKLPVVRLLPLTGLPGDGDKALAAAMRRMLERAGLKVTETEGPADFTVRGQITLTPGGGADETLAAAWVVAIADGTDLGSAAQQGAVPKGRLTQPWGSLAGDIAAGGAEGVIEIIRAAMQK